MKARRPLALAGVLLCAVVGTVLMVRSTRPESAADSARSARRDNHSPGPHSVAAPQIVVGPKVPFTRERIAVNPGLGESAQQPPASGTKSLTQSSGPKKGKDPIQDPMAREALAWVGYNEEAEVYWAAAINDPSLSAQERQDLIEDLNEDGISDPKNPSLDDLPIILNRLDLIESLVPGAMDQVNADAFMEAYKDLVNLANVAVGGGEPVR